MRGAGNAGKVCAVCPSHMSQHFAGEFGGGCPRVLVMKQRSTLSRLFAAKSRRWQAICRPRSVANAFHILCSKKDGEEREAETGEKREEREEAERQGGTPPASMPMPIFLIPCNPCNMPAAVLSSPAWGHTPSSTVPCSLQVHIGSESCL